MKSYAYSMKSLTHNMKSYEHNTKSRAHSKKSYTHGMKSLVHSQKSYTHGTESHEKRLQRHKTHIKIDMNDNNSDKNTKKQHRYESASDEQRPTSYATRQRARSQRHAKREPVRG